MATHRSEMAMVYRSPSARKPAGNNREPPGPGAALIADRSPGASCLTATANSR